MFSPGTEAFAPSESGLTLTTLGLRRAEDFLRYQDTDYKCGWLATYTRVAMTSLMTCLWHHTCNRSKLSPRTIRETDDKEGVTFNDERDRSKVGLLTKINNNKTH